MPSPIQYRLIKPDPSLAAFVESFWLLRNTSNIEKEVVVLPDGRVDLFFSRSDKEPFHITLMGIGTEADQAGIAPGTVMFAISFKLPAIEYLFGDEARGLLNSAKALPAGFWGFSDHDLDDFNLFCQKAAQHIKALLPAKETDDRKRKLFELIYAHKGSLSVNNLAEQAGWSSRQINRYFNQHFGLSLKAYCSILRFRASFEQIREGKLFPEQSFADQSHFIKEIKRLSGALPKELSRNKNDRFIQFSTLPRK